LVQFVSPTREELLLKISRLETREQCAKALDSDARCLMALKFGKLVHCGSPEPDEFKNPPRVKTKMSDSGTISAKLEFEL